MRVHLNSGAVASLGRLAVVKADVHRVATEIADDAKNRAPVASGTLRNSIEAIPDPDVPDAYRVVMEWYGIFPEFGTSRQPAQPFMRPAADAAR